MAGMAAAEAAPWLVVLSWGEMWMEEAQKSGSDRQPAGHPLGALTLEVCSASVCKTYGVWLKLCPYFTLFRACVCHYAISELCQGLHHHNGV